MPLAPTGGSSSSPDTRRLPHDHPATGSSPDNTTRSRRCSPTLPPRRTQAGTRRRPGTVRPPALPVRCWPA